MIDWANLRNALRMLVRGFWQYLREVSGETDYARYRARPLAGGEKLMTPREFYNKQFQEKYSRPNRCC